MTSYNRQYHQDLNPNVQPTCWYEQIVMLSLYKPMSIKELGHEILWTHVFTTRHHSRKPDRSSGQGMIDLKEMPRATRSRPNSGRIFYFFSTCVSRKWASNSISTVRFHWFSWFEKQIKKIRQEKISKNGLAAPATRQKKK